LYRVILADDSDEFLSWLGSLLEGSQDFQVVGQASHGVEALGLIQRLMPDLVIADVEMPGLDGLDLARCVGARWQGIKVILISAHEERQYDRLAREEGAMAFISKARLSLQALLQALQEAALP
jgi:YesN/AraC family two-component response regulator